MNASATQENHGDILTQSEVATLLAQVADDDRTVAVHKADHSVEQRDREAVQPYDFRHPAFLSASELRKLRLGHDEFLRALAARLSIYLRMDFSLQLAKLHTLPFRQFAAGLTTPTCTTIFKVEPLRGICLLDLHPALALTLLDRLLGGPGTNVNTRHTPTDIELSLIDQAVTLMLTEWCKHWHPLALRPALLGHEDNGHFLQTSTDETMMVVVAMDARLGDCQAPIHLAFPYFTIEPIIRQVCASLETAAQPTEPSPARPVQWNSQLDDVLVPVTAQWEDLVITARELSQLKVGDFIQLSPDCAEEIQIRLASKAKFVGRLGTQGNHRAVELQQTVHS